MRRGQRIRELMAQENIPSLRKMAARVGVSPATLSEVMNRKITVSGPLRDAFEIAFPQVNQSWLFPLEPDDPEPTNGEAA